MEAILPIQPGLPVKLQREVRRQGDGRRATGHISDGGAGPVGAPAVLRRDRQTARRRPAQASARFQRLRIVWGIAEPGEDLDWGAVHGSDGQSRNRASLRSAIARAGDRGRASAGTVKTIGIEIEISARAGRAVLLKDRSCFRHGKRGGHPDAGRARSVCKERHVRGARTRPALRGIGCGDPEARARRRFAAIFAPGGVLEHARSCGDRSGRHGGCVAVDERGPGPRYRRGRYIRPVRMMFPGQQDQPCADP